MNDKLKEYVTQIVENAPGRNATERIKYVSKSIGCGRTHLYEMLAGHRELNSLKVAQKLRDFGVPADVILP